MIFMRLGMQTWGLAAFWAAIIMTLSILRMVLALTWAFEDCEGCFFVYGSSLRWAFNGLSNFEWVALVESDFERME